MSLHLRKHLKNDINIIQPSEIKYRTQIGVCVSQTLKKRGYTKSDSESMWNIYWAEKQLIESVYSNYRVNREQKINHYRNYYELCKKDNLNRNIKKYKRTLQRQGKQNEASQYNFCPLTYHLPLQYSLFLEQFKKKIYNQNKNIWIMKPVGSSQGKGIFLFNKISSIEQWSENSEAQPYIVQKYIQNPLLLGGKKFDLRIYVLCTSYRPLDIYLYRSGFARLTHFRYDSNKINQNQIHLTNVAIQKNTSDYNEENGGKWVLDKLKIYLLSKFNFNLVNKCFYQIQHLIVKTLRSVSKIMSNQKNCFQLYGFDILIDSNLFPWLIEVNGSPSMRANTQKDRQMKCAIIDDVLSIVDLEKIMQGNQQQIGGFDLICKKDIMKTHQYFGGNKLSMLGCLNNRQKNYKQIAKQINNKVNKTPPINKNSNNVVRNPQSSPVKSFSVRKKNISSQFNDQPNQMSNSQIYQPQQQMQDYINTSTKNWRVKNHIRFTTNPQKIINN